MPTLNYELIVAVIALLIAAAGTYFQYRQLKLDEARTLSRAELRRGDSGRPSIWRRYGLVGVLLLVAALAWVPYFLRDDTRGAVVGWGYAGRVGGKPALSVSVDGKRIISYGGGYRIAAVAFHYKGDVDIEDVATLEKSNTYDIRDGLLRVMIYPSDQFWRGILDGHRPTTYVTLLVPKNLKMQDFRSLRHAYNQGVLSLGSHQGPPP